MNNKKIRILIIFIVLLHLFTAPLYSRPRVEISLSYTSPQYYNEWYKIYDLKLIANPSSHFGFRLQFGELDFDNERVSINSSIYESIECLFYSSGGLRKNVIAYLSLGLRTAYNGDFYGEDISYFSFSLNFGLGLDWYFLNRIACFLELEDLLMLYFSRYLGETSADARMHPGIIFGVKFNIY